MPSRWQGIYKNMEENCTEKKVEAVLIKKWHLIIGVITIVAPAILFFAKIQLDVALIKQQTEYIAEAIQEAQTANKEQDAIIAAQKNKITEICVKTGIPIN